MSDNKLNITSSLLEKGIDIAKDFVDKLIMPSVEETGLLLKDKISLWRFNNQVKTLVKAKDICTKNNISTKQISLKLLCPILEYSSIEDDDFLTDKWATLLSNLVDSQQNIQNHVFPYILSQISKKEFLILERIFDEKENRMSKIREELNNYYINKENIEEEHSKRLISIDKKINDFTLVDNKPNFDLLQLYKQKSAINSKLQNYKHKEALIKYSLERLEIVSVENFENFELSNLLRLGLIKEDKDVYAKPQTINIPIDQDDYESYASFNLEVDVRSETKYLLTEFGELFIKVCKEKQQAM